MLQRNIDVASDLVAPRDGVDKFIAPMRRVRIKQTHPEVPLDFLNFAKKAGKRWAARRVHWLTGSGLRCPKIHPVIGRVLADQINLANTFADESPNFRQHRLWRTAAVLPAHLWNHAKTARMIAALCNLYVGGMRGRKPEARSIVIRNVSGPRVCECQIDLTVFRRNVQRPTSNAQLSAFGVACSVLSVGRFLKILSMISPRWLT